ncbi:MAG: hypothetical protein R3E66_08320 [bacterium]
MASVMIPSEDRTLTNVDDIQTFLAEFGIWYRHFDGSDNLAMRPETRRD